MTDHTFALAVGTELNHYVIESVLGQGGFGVVYKAHHALLHETVVIKEFLPVELAGRQGHSVVPHGQSKQALYDDCLQRFLAEGRTLVKLRHPNVVRCRDLFNANGTAYLVMDFEDGLPLDLLIKSLEQQGLRYSEQQLLHFLLPLCDGLDYIHQQGVLHRDIKPANVFIRRNDGSPVIIDFGAAKQNFAAASQSQAPYTEFYAPLEQIEGSGQAKPSVDVHAFGGLMYRIVTGQVGPRAEARAMALISNQPDPLKPSANLAGDYYSATLLATIDRCLAFLPHERPASMQAVKELLETQQEPATHRDNLTKNDMSQLDELLALAGSDSIITDGEMQLLLNKAKALKLDAVLAQQYIVQQCMQRGWQLHSAQSASKPDQSATAATNGDVFSDIFGARQSHSAQQSTQNIVLDHDKITLCVERNSPALKGKQLAAHIGIETQGRVFTPLVHSGESLNQAYRQVFSTAEDYQQAVEIHLLRANEPNIDSATSLSKVNIGLAQPAPAGVPQIEISLYVLGSDLYLDVQRLDQAVAHATANRAAKATDGPAEVVGISGWLWLVMLTLFSKCLLAAGRLAQLYNDYEAQLFRQPSAPWNELYSTSIGVLGVYLLATFVLLVLFFRRSRHFVKVYTGVVIGMFFVDSGAFPLLFEQFNTSTIELLASVLLYELIVLSYLHWSERVKKTFVR